MYTSLRISPTELGSLIQTTRAMIDFFSKAKAAKLLRELVDRFLDMHRTGVTTGREVCGADDSLPYIATIGQFFCIKDTIS